jgi:hypothetical protein
MQAVIGLNVFKAWLFKQAMFRKAMFRKAPV